jgi:hypothetical protein
MCAVSTFPCSPYPPSTTDPSPPTKAAEPKDPHGGGCGDGVAKCGMGVAQAAGGLAAGATSRVIHTCVSQEAVADAELDREGLGVLVVAVLGLGSLKACTSHAAASMCPK